MDGRVFRVINTHLEPLQSEVRNAQAMEILDEPANTKLPVIVMGDVNSTPGSDTYNLFTKKGFDDVWIKAGQGLGFTGHQNPDLLNAGSELSRRIDFIFYKNGWKPIAADLVGEEKKDRTITGLWPSDHAGVAAKLLQNDIC